MSKKTNGKLDIGISKKIIDLAKKIKKHNINVRSIGELKIKNEALEKQIETLEKEIRILKLNLIKQNKLLKQIKELEEEKKRLKLELEKSKASYHFIITTPRDASNTVYGEISRELSGAQKEVLICSPWITYIVDELSTLGGRGRKKKVNIKVITRLIKEDIDKELTDLDKLRVLQDLGAEIRYNNNLHAKMVIIDNSVAIISSANLTKKGLIVNYEAGVCLKDKNEVNKVAQFFNDVWKESKPLTEEAMRDVLSE